MRYLILLLLSFNASADYYASAEYLRVNQKLFDKIDFKMDVAAIGVKKEFGNVGVKLLVGKSTETPNSLFLNETFYTNKITKLIQASVSYRFNLSDSWSLSPFVSYTDYKTKWTANGIEPEWSNGSDSDIGYGLYVNYKYHKNYSMIFSVQDMYRKHKKGYGDEKTYAFGFGFEYKF